VLALLVVLGQAALSFSDVDGVGWALVGAYLLLVAGYVRWRGRTMIPIKVAA
jgi:hypothetical protein